MKKFGTSVVSTARKWVDYQEKKTNGTEEQLSNKHWNPGSNNYTIFWLWFLRHFGWTCQGQAWCLGSAIEHYVNTYGVDETMGLLRIAKKSDLALVNCNEFVETHYGDGRLSKTPLTVGALCFFHNGKRWSHVGIVSGIYNTYVTTIEGNTSGGDNKVDPDGGAVVEKKHSFSSVKMMFWNPDFDDEESETESVFVDGKAPIAVGSEGLVVSCELCYRESPYNGKVLGSFNAGDRVFPVEKAFVKTKQGVNAWYRDEHGWFAARRVSDGWVKERNGRWWLIKLGYECDYNKMFDRDGETYYADNTGYIAQSRWVDTDGVWRYFDHDGKMVKYAYVKDRTENKYYWLNSSGVWLDSETTDDPDLVNYYLAY